MMQTLQYTKVFGCFVIFFVLLACSGDESKGPPKLPMVEGQKLSDSYKIALEKAQNLEIYSLQADPLPPSTPGQTRPQIDEELHGWPVLGKTSITDQGRRKQLVSAFEKAITDFRGMRPACFFPRHAIRAIHDGRTYDFVICFQCVQVKIYGDFFSMFGPAAYLVGAAPEPAFDEILRNAKIVLSRDLAKQ